MDFVVDLDNCADEPIHIPGFIQPRGVLMVITEPNLILTQATANLEQISDFDAASAIGQPLDRIIGPGPAGIIARAAAAFGDLRDRNPHDVVISHDGREDAYDAILYRLTPGLIMVELEIAFGPRPFSFPNTYQAVRQTVAELNQTLDLSTLYNTTAQAVRDLTGFDRVMVYRYDADFNGEVVAEAKRPDLNQFLGLRYPASDIPAQARALYEKNWIRLISDIDYTPVPVIPTLVPGTNAPLDMTYSTLRSVSPIHVEYLQNMGVRASMSISLLRDGSLWGLIACHHYSGPHAPPYGVRAAAEFLGSTLSLRLVDRAEEESLRQLLAARDVLDRLNSRIFDVEQPLANALLGTNDLFKLIAADGIAVGTLAQQLTSGTTPGGGLVDDVASWAADSGEEVVVTACLIEANPELGDPECRPDALQACGVLSIQLPDNQFVQWFRGESRYTVDWGGDPHNKIIASQEGANIRLSPRKSFDRWQEAVRHHSVAWTDEELALARELRGRIVESFYLRSQREIHLAETMQRSLLPRLPEIDGWRITAQYEPATGDRLGGDWYDAFALPDGRTALVVGDVAGHGVTAAGTMAQLRNALRAYLHEHASPTDALAKLNTFAVALLPGAHATVVVAVLDPVTGELRMASSGHPPPYVAGASGGSTRLSWPIAGPLGLIGARQFEFQTQLQPGESLVLYTDGLIERRYEDLLVGLDRLAAALAGGHPDLDAGTVVNLLASRSAGAAADAESATDVSFDDTTVVVLHRLN